MQQLPFILLILCCRTTASNTFIIPINGQVDGVPNFTDGEKTIKFQPSRYEPICGTFGPHEQFDEPSVDYYDVCTAAMDTFSNNTVDTVALYDTDGARLLDARVGGGISLCMCFAMSGSGSIDMWSDFCFSVTAMGLLATGRTDGMDYLSYDYRPNAQKTLPKCIGSDVDALRNSWSSTAYQATMTEARSTVNDGLGNILSTIVKTKTLTPTVVSITLSTLVTSTLANGSLIVSTSFSTSLAAVITNSPSPSSTDESKGGSLSQSDKIAMGVGITFGVSTMILMIVLAYWKFTPT